MAGYIFFVFQHAKSLVCLYCPVDIGDKRERTHKSNETEHHKEGVGNDAGVSKIKRYLQQAVHIRSMKEIEERISKNKNSGRSSIEKHTPPPSMVFASELEVKQRDGDKGSHNH